jgi:hypothetical protein
MTDSWWVRNARDLEWTSNKMGEYCLLAADEFAINLNVLGPGQPMALYHHEPHQEDYFHCPPGVPHVVVGAGDEGALVIAVGSRVGGGNATYPNDPDPRAAYAEYGEPQKVESPL